MSRQLVVIAHNLRSCHNVGSLLRTCEGLGITHVYLTGYSPYPTYEGDPRLPHEANKLTKQIQKTALGAETSQAWTANLPLDKVVQKLRQDSFTVCALEQAPESVNVPDYSPPEKLAILLGSERYGVEKDVLELMDFCLEIPMRGQKESFNVVEAAAMALYHLTYMKV